MNITLELLFPPIRREQPEQECYFYFFNCMSAYVLGSRIISLCMYVYILHFTFSLITQLHDLYAVYFTLF